MIDYSISFNISRAKKINLRLITMQYLSLALSIKIITVFWLISMYVIQYKVSMFMFHCHLYNYLLLISKSSYVSWMNFLYKIKLQYSYMLPYKDIIVKIFYLNKFHRKLSRTKSHQKTGTTIIISYTNKTN